MAAKKRSKKTAAPSRAKKKSPKKAAAPRAKKPAAKKSAKKPAKRQRARGKKTFVEKLVDSAVGAAKAAALVYVGRKVKKTLLGDD